MCPPYVPSLKPWMRLAVENEWPKYDAGRNVIPHSTPLPWQPRENISRKQASRDITGSKKHIYAQGRLNPVISQPKYGRCERKQRIVIDNNEGIKSHQSTNAATCSQLQLCVALEESAKH